LGCTEKYADFNVRHFQEKLREKHHIRLSSTWVKRAFQMAGLVKKSRKRGVASMPESLMLRVISVQISSSLQVFRDQVRIVLQVQCQTEAPVHLVVLTPNFRDLPSFHSTTRALEPRKA
jgi:hypothetical protein